MLCSIEHNKKNWVMIDTIAGAEASEIIYSIVETAKANNLKPYDYMEYLLTVCKLQKRKCRSGMSGIKYVKYSLWGVYEKVD